MKLEKQKEKRRVMRKRDGLTKGPRLMSNILKKELDCMCEEMTRKSGIRVHFLGGSGGFKYNLI